VLVPVVVCWAGIDVGWIGVVTLARSSATQVVVLLGCW